MTILHRFTTEISIFAGAQINTGSASITVPVVLWGIFNGASSSVYRETTLLGSGAAGTNTLTGVTIGCLNDGGTAQFIGPIAHVSLYHGAKLANAATVAAAARQYYGI
jgi:hypothetical protein